MAMIMQPTSLIQPATLTTLEAHEYVRKRVFWEWLVEHYQLEPIFKGKQHKTILWRRDAIDHALRQLELSGGFDIESGKPVQN
jgi:hypothetical protein